MRMLNLSIFPLSLVVLLTTLPCITSTLMNQIEQQQGETTVCNNETLYGAPLHFAIFGAPSENRNDGVLVVTKYCCPRSAA